MRTFITSLLYIVIFLVVGFLIVYVFLFINNGQKAFYIQYGELEIRTKAENIELPANNYSVFYCKNSLGLGAEYDVKIVFVEKLDFKVDNEPYNFGAIADISKSFNLVKDKDFFTIFIDEDLTIEKILKSVYEGKRISDIPEIDLSKKDYFKLIITSANNDKDVVYISFRLGGV